MPSDVDQLRSYNRLHSIADDADFVRNEVGAAYPDFPLVGAIALVMITVCINSSDSGPFAHQRINVPVPGTSNRPPSTSTPTSSEPLWRKRLLPRSRDSPLVPADRQMDMRGSTTLTFDVRWLYEASCPCRQVLTALSSKTGANLILLPIIKERGG